MIIDFHAHAFPDAVAAKAIPALAAEGNILAFTDGTVDSLLASMERAEIDACVICSIATRPAQYESILKWSGEIASPRLIPLPSVHPADPDASAQIHTIKRLGFAGIKMHPYYQDFFLDEPRMYPLYDALCETGIFLLVHCGFDIAFPRIRRAVPEQIVTVLAQFPALRLITTHFGGWDTWAEVEEQLLGKEIYMEISFSLNSLPFQQARRMLNRHPAEFLLFGSDSPWEDQEGAVKRLQDYRLAQDRLDLLLGANAAQLLAPHFATV
jgi:predicted TIM-barrel fold metal-dependent hydrolase